MNAGDLVGGKYRLTQRLGAGAMGAVWAAINERTGRKVALKLILHPTDDLRDRLRREAQACGSLEHRNIIEIYDVGETESGDPFLVMQLLYGETLAEMLHRRRRLPPMAAARIGRDIASALAAAHEAKIVHRDLKPANIFLSREGEKGSEDAFVLKVLDFGVSKNLANGDCRATATGAMVGSPAYMSPEQIRMSRDVDNRTDIWSLGIILFEMLAGARPFHGTAQEIVRQVLVSPIPSVSSRVRHTPRALDAIVERCLSRDCHLRYDDAKEIEQALAAYTEAPGLDDSGADAETTVPLRGRATASPTGTALLSPADQVPSPARDRRPPQRMPAALAYGDGTPPKAASVSDAGISVEASRGDVTPRMPVRRRAFWLYTTAGAGLAAVTALGAALMIGRPSALPAELPAPVLPAPSAAASELKEAALPPVEPAVAPPPPTSPVATESTSAPKPSPSVRPKPLQIKQPPPAVESRRPKCGMFIKTNCDR